MDLKPFKNKNGSIYKKKKIKLAIYDEIKRIRALSQIIIYTNFK